MNEPVPLPTPTKKPVKSVCLNVLAAVASAIALYNAPAGDWLTEHGDLICTIGLAAANAAIHLWKARSGAA